MDEGLARELELFREALALPTVGMRQASDLELLRSLIHQYPAQAKRCVDELYGWSPARPVAGEGPRGPGVASRRAGTGCD